MKAFIMYILAFFNKKSESDQARIFVRREKEHPCGDALVVSVAHGKTLAIECVFLSAMDATFYLIGIEAALDATNVKYNYGDHYVIAEYQDDHSVSISTVIQEWREVIDA